MFAAMAGPAKSRPQALVARQGTKLGGDSGQTRAVWCHGTLKWRRRALKVTLS